MRLLTTLLYGLAAALALVIGAATMIGAPNPGDVPHGGLTAATVLASDGTKHDGAALQRPAAPAQPAPDSPSS